MSSLIPFLNRFLTRVWVEGDAGAIPEMMAPDAVIHGLEELGQDGAREFLRFHAMILRQFNQISVVPLQGLEQGNWVSQALKVSATEISSNRRVSFVAHVTCEVRDGKVTQGYNVVDFLGLFEQLGRLPPRTLDHCLLERRLELV